MLPHNFMPENLIPLTPLRRRTTPITVWRRIIEDPAPFPDAVSHTLEARLAALTADNERLTAENVLLRHLYERAPLGYQSLDENGCFLSVNQAWVDALGYSREEVIGRNFGNFLHPDWQDHFRENFPRFKAVGEILGVEFEMVRKDGSTILVSFHGKIGKDPEGQFRQTHCIFQDITRRKQVERALQESEERLLQIVESLGEGVILQDTSERILLFNRTAAEIFDVNPVEIIGELSSKRVWSTIREDGSPFHEQDHPSLYTLRTGQPCNGVIMGITRSEQDTKWIKINTRPLFAKGDAQPYAVVISFSDITERKHIEIALNDQKAYLQSILRAAPTGIGVTKNRVLQEVNIRLCEMTGFAENELLKQNSRMLYPDEAEYNWVGEEKYKQISQYGIGTVETQWQRKDGVNIDVLLSSAPIDRKDLSRGVTFTALDVTDRKRMEAELLAAKIDLERRVEQRTLELQETQKKFLHAEKLSAIGKLSASIAHEFNNPMQGILSILKGLKKRAILEEEDRKLLDAAIGEGDRIKNLIHSLQDFNRPSSGKRALMDVHHALESILLLHKNDFNSRRITVERNYTEGLPQIIAISDQIKQVFLNLLTNAAEACNHYGGVIKVSTWQENNMAAVMIKDTGIGIKPEEMEHIFRPFYTTKGAVKGTGLGLSVSYGIVKKHHGEIRVESQPGEGTTFTVLLPIKST